MDSDGIDSGSDLTSSSDEDPVYKPVHGEMIKEFELAVKRNASMPTQSGSNHWSEIMRRMLDQLKKAEKHIKKVEEENARLEKKPKDDKEKFKSKIKEIETSAMGADELCRKALEQSRKTEALLSDSR